MGNKSSQLTEHKNHEGKQNVLAEKAINRYRGLRRSGTLPKAKPRRGSRSPIEELDDGTPKFGSSQDYSSDDGSDTKPPGSSPTNTDGAADQPSVSKATRLGSFADSGYATQHTRGSFSAQTNVSCNQDGGEMSCSMNKHERDIDLITSAPPRNASKPSEVVDVTACPKAPSEAPLGDTCSLCDHKIGDYREFKKNYEKRVFLPCGHSFGHHCLFNWIGEAHARKERCPHGDCTTLRHICEHVTIPSLQPPRETFKDKNSPVIPNYYEFCETPRAQGLHTSITKLASKSTRMELSVLEYEGMHRKLFYRIRAKTCAHLLWAKEKKLDKLQKAFSKQAWENFESEIQEPSSLALQKPKVYGWQQT